MPYSDIESSREYSAVTPSDTVNFTRPCRGIYVGSTGNVVAVPLLPSSSVNGAFVGGTPVTFIAVQAGSYLPIWAIRVNSTSTTAGAIVALF